MKITTKLPAEHHNHGELSPARQFLTLGVCLALLVVTVYFAGGVLISRAVMYIPQNWEHQLFARLFTPDDTHEHDAQNAQVQTLLDRIVTTTPEVSLALRATVISDAAINAMALPGGTILVTDSLLKSAQSENEIVMVLAHEVGHFTLRHHLRRVGRLLVLPALTALVFGDPSLTSIAQRSSTLVELSYSRQEELAADSFALEALNRVYGHVAGATDFFQRDSSLGPNVPGEKYVSSHPVSEARVHALSLQIRERGYQIKSLVAKSSALD